MLPELALHTLRALLLIPKADRNHTYESKLAPSFEADDTA